MARTKRRTYSSITTRTASLRATHGRPSCSRTTMCGSPTPFEGRAITRRSKASTGASKARITRSSLTPKTSANSRPWSLDPKNSGWLAGTQRIGGELWVSEHPSRAQSTSDFVLLLRRTGEQSKYGGSTILEVSFDDLRHIKHQRYRSPNRLSNRHGPPKTEIRESLRDRLRKDSEIGTRCWCRRNTGRVLST